MGAQTSVKQNFSIRDLFTGLDIPLLLTIIALLILGLVVLYSASMPVAIEYDYHPIEDVLEQGRWALLGLFIALFISLIDYRKLQPYIFYGLALAIIALILVLLVGEERFGATRTFFNGRIQPSEITKVILILYLAFWLKTKGEFLQKISLWVIPLGSVLGFISVLIYLEPDFSALLTILIITGILLFLAHIDWWQVIIIALAGTGMFALVIRFTGTGAIRWEQFRTGWRDPGEAISQVQRTFESIVNGGIFGVGIGQGQVKFTGLEVGQTDTIFTIIAEELGLIGCLIVLGLFTLILWRGIKISQASSDLSGQLIAAGITFWIVAEAFINIASLINLIQIGRNTLPFFSKGGSSMISIMTAVRFILSVSRVKKKKKIKERSSYSAVVDMRWRDRGRSVSRARSSSSTHR